MCRMGRGGPSLAIVGASCDPDTAFTPATTAALAAAACAQAGLDGGDAELIRLGENALYRLRRERAVVRIGRSVERWHVAAKEVAVSRWLAGVGFPVVRLLDGVAQPQAVEGHVVTYWELIDRPRAAPAVDIARVIRQLHSLPPPVDPLLPRFDPFDRVPERLERAALLSGDDRGFLREHLTRVRTQYQADTADAPDSVIHGDAHGGNILHDPHGRLIVLDLERFGLGPREWDLSLSATYHCRLGWWSVEKYESFVSAYGSDVRDSPIFGTLCDTHELQMTTWLAQRYGESPAIATEVQERIACLRDADRPRRWHAY